MGPYIYITFFYIYCLKDTISGLSFLRVLLNGRVAGTIAKVTGFNHPNPYFLPMIIICPKGFLLDLLTCC